MFHPKGPTFFELARQALSSTERGYDLLAPKFEYTPFRTPDHVVSAVAAALGPPGSLEHALDICCGTGVGVSFLRPLCRRSVWGIDASAGMLAEARRRLAGAPGTAEIELVRGAVMAMPFEDVFDAATCFGALGHFPRKEERAFLDAVRRVLKIGGRFAFVTSAVPPMLSRRWLFARAFNAAMHVRNALWRPPFVMYYLTFPLPAIRKTLQTVGFAVEERPGLFAPPFHSDRLVLATRIR
ncbi:MAG: class I SAM-dependent methyltransferase [Deltaproteobacteria bacterium]|nr:class I SAM-dependent methyltransferase [Deltaproteobacteria bacterium]